MTRALTGILLTYVTLASASAQSPQKLPGSWVAGDERFGLVFEKNDGHPYFAYGNCDRQGSRAQARLNLEIDQKLFGDVIATRKYIIVRWIGDRSKGDLIVEGLTLIEDGPQMWVPWFMASLETLDQWRAASRVELTIGVREADGTGFESRHRYVLPDDNRQTALASFIRSCSGKRVGP